jgi:hypothetical protein
MISKRMVREAVLMGVLVIGGLWASAGLLQKGLEAENRLGAKRLEETATLLIEKAHRLKDDLLMQGTIQALARAPGIALACVVDRDGTVLSHNRPDELGKTFRMPSPTGNLWTRPLHEDQESWGTLIFTTSTAGVHKVWLEQLLLQIGLGALLWICFVARCLVWERQLKKAQAELMECEALLAEEKARYPRLEKRFQDIQLAAIAWLQKAVDQLPFSLVLLDQRQYVIVANQSAFIRLGADSAASLAGKSWHEIPLLAPCGDILEQSLASPGRLVEWSGENGDLRLTFETDSGDSPGTWVVFLTSKHVVE